IRDCVVTKTVVNWASKGYFGLCNETPLKVWFGCDASWPPKSACSRRRRGPDSVRWGRPGRAIFPADWFAGFPLAPHSVCPTKYAVQCQRVAGSVALSADSRARSDRNHRATPLQRSLSLLGRLAGLSGSQQSAALPGAVRTGGTERFSQVARPLAHG